MDKINWFPGHMAKTIKHLKDLKSVDLILQILDSRCIETSKNPEITSQFNKPVLSICLKEDLSDIKHLNDKEYLSGNAKNLGFRQVLLKKIYSYFQEKITKLINKGLLKPQFYILVIGLPNIGKSTIINLLLGKNRLIAQNKPGVTRRTQAIKINDNFWLYDTPGIMIKNINNEDDGYVLSLINVINKNILPLKDVCEWTFNFYLKKYKDEMFKYFSIPETTEFGVFIDSLCDKYKFIINDVKFDYYRMYEFLYDVFVNCKICKVSYE